MQVFMKFFGWLIVLRFYFDSNRSSTPVMKWKTMLIHNGSPSITLDGKTYVLNDDFVWENSKTYLVPKGFTTDLATIPSLLDPLFAKHRNLIDTAAVLHDQGCEGYQIVNGETTKIKRKLNDRLFYDCLLDIGVPRAIAFRCYIAVRFWSILTQKNNYPHVQTRARPKN